MFIVGIIFGIVYKMYIVVDFMVEKKGEEVWKRNKEIFLWVFGGVDYDLNFFYGFKVYVVRWKKLDLWWVIVIEVWNN